MKNIRHVRYFELKPLQRVRFLNRFKEFITCQITNQKIINVPDSDCKNYLSVKNSTTTFYDVPDFELKKKSNGENLVKENCNTSTFAFKLLERVRIWEVYFLQRVRIWNKLLLNARFWIDMKEWSASEMKFLEFSEILNSISYNVSDFETKS